MNRQTTLAMGLLAVAFGLGVAIQDSAQNLDPVASPSIGPSTQSAPEARGGWLTDPEAALKKAEAEKKVVLMNFEGSDWCVWCKKLDKEVFLTSEFDKYAAKHLVLLSVDFPRRKALAPEVVQRNQDLAAQYGVDAFPTLVITDSAGKELGRLTGYQRGGPSAFIRSVQGILKRVPAGPAPREDGAPSIIPSSLAFASSDRL